MTKTDYWLKWFLPGMVLIAVAFWAGTLRQPIFALAGFLSFFSVGVTLIMEGRNRRSRATGHKDT
ncbi:MAG: hypothetical protein BWY42_00230 [Candidatus Omnitrophica bacterium ADurb.Bin277]|nr:MAG: hypothetical protein BWY42_00230 [Candidatus Omnitrophica bacterium ADurb.Bin277]